MKTSVQHNARRMRTFAAIALGFAGSTAIWIATPCNNFILRLGYISDSYLPIGAVFILLVLVLAVNPALRKLRPRWALSRRQLAIILGMMLVASVLPGQGLLRYLPGLAGTCVKVNASQQLAEVYCEIELPPSLFPDRIGFGEPTPASEPLIGELLPGQPIPWAAWLRPLLAWGSFLLFYGLMMIGLSMVVLPQWRHNERLAFPLLEVQTSYIETPPEGRALAPLFRTRAFWSGCALVFVLYLLYGANIYFPGRVPAVSLSWDLGRCFTEEPLCYLPWPIYRSKIYFLFVAIAFFMPTRISFSIWFIELAYAAYVVIGKAYFPPFHWGTVSDHRSGAMLVLTAVILWLGRQRWARVARAVLRRPETDADRQDRRAGLIFAAGIVGTAGWFLWAGAEPLWALLLASTGFVVCLLITRLVAETGMPSMRMYDCAPHMWMGMAPASWVGGASVFLGGVASIVFHSGSRVNGMTMATHAFALEEEATGARESRRQPLRAGLLLAVLLTGLCIGGAAHLYLNCHHSVTLDGVESPISPIGVSSLNGTHQLLLSWQRGQLPHAPYKRPMHILFGAGFAGLLQWACITMPKWPLHPIGILMACTYYGNFAWSSIFLGWLIKILLLRYGGSRLYRGAKPFFLGLIAGEVFATAFWAAIPAILVLLGKPYTPVHIQML